MVKVEDLSEDQKRMILEARHSCSGGWWYHGDGEPRTEEHNSLIKLGVFAEPNTGTKVYGLRLLTPGLRLRHELQEGSN